MLQTTVTSSHKKDPQSAAFYLGRHFTSR